MQNNPSILIGNSFPLSLIRRTVRMEPLPLEALQKAASGKTIVSFWGHANTLSIASAYTALDLAPQQPYGRLVSRPSARPSHRPILSLSSKNLPTLDNQTFRECWIVSPDYVSSFRPAIGEEVPPEKIAGWQILKITWE